MIDPITITSIVSICLLSISEILALTPLRSNGVIHAFIVIVNDLCKPTPIVSSV